MEIIIKPRKGWIGINVQELWRYRELLYIFTWRDIKVRYKQTAIGILWAILQPFFTMVIFSLFFGGLAKIPSDGVPYPLFVFSGLLFWNYFSASLLSASTSLQDNESILKKIYFPRLFLPLSPTLTPMVDFFLAFLILVGMMFYYHYAPTWYGILLIPVLLFMAFLTAAGLGTLFSAINVRYRDVKYALPFMVQSLLFLTPVIYPTTLVSPKYQWLLALNPLTGIIETARSGITGAKPINFLLLLTSAIICIILFFLGIFYFRKTERIFADIA